MLAGIGKVESDDGRTNLKGVTSGSNEFGAAGPMQIGIGGASSNPWGGAAIHKASLVVSGVATDENGDGLASVYEVPDAIAGAAKYLVQHGVQQNVPAAIFAYNHANWYVQEVLSWASTYASGGFTVAGASQSGGTANVTGAGGQSCTQNSVLASFVAPNTIVATAVSYAEAQLGKPYLWGGTGPAAYDCSGLVMMAYRAAGVNIAQDLTGPVEVLAEGPRVQGDPRRPGVLRRRRRHGQGAGACRAGDREEHDDRGLCHGLSDQDLHVRHAAVAWRRNRGRRLRPALAGQGLTGTRIPGIGPCRC